MITHCIFYEREWGRIHYQLLRVEERKLFVKMFPNVEELIIYLIAQYNEHLLSLQ